MNSKQEQMREILKDEDSRQQIIEEHVNEGIAFQIRSLRNRQELNQSQLAKKMNLKQSQISEWENPNYGKYTLATLKELAKAFDVGLLVRFVPFSKLVDWTVNLTSDIIAPPSFAEEQKHALTSGAGAPNPIDNSLYDYMDANGLLSGTSLSASTIKVQETKEERVPVYA